MPANCEVFHGVLISPKNIEFHNAYEGKVFKEKVTIQNVSPKSVIIKTLSPNSTSFKVDKLFHGEQLSSGLKIVIWVSYTYSQCSTLYTQMTVYVNCNPCDITLEVFPSKSEIYSKPRNLNFGTINLGYVHVEKLTLYNKGNRQTKFEFDVSQNSLGLSMNPRKGFIPGGDHVVVEVYIIGFDEGIFKNEMWVKCEQPFRVHICVEVIKPKLYICSPHDYTESFLPIMFPPVYGGCRVSQSFDVFNFNMLKTTFIIVPEYNKQIMAAHKVEEIDPTYKRFSFSPIEGDLNPSDSRTIEISFEPPKEKLLSDQVYFVCFCLIRLDCQTVNKTTSDILKKKPFQKQPKYIAIEQSASCASIQKLDTVSDEIQTIVDSVLEPIVSKKSFGNYIRICAYALVKSLKVSITPLNIELPEMLINTQVVQFMNIQNKSKTLPVYFEYEKIGYIKVKPPKGYIGINEKISVKVYFKPTAAGAIDKPMTIHFLNYSQPRDQKKKELINVGSVSIPVYIPVGLETKQPKPEFNMGITPKITNEVGLMVDNIRFSTKVKKPRMAVMQCYKAKPAKKFDNAKISFPNDRPQALQPWRNKNIKCKTIFAELPRVIAPTDEYMLTQDEILKKIKNNDYYLEYIRYLQRKRAERYCEKPLEDYIPNNKKLLQNISNMYCPQHWKKIFGTYYQKEFTPLKPIQIYFVKISPQKIFLSGIVVNTTVQYSIEIFNENIFSVHTLLTSFLRDKTILPNLPEERIVKSNEKITITKQFAPVHSGLFSTILNVYLNSSHFIPILLQAEVVRPTVTVDCKEITFDEKEPGFVRIFPLRNNLNVPIIFSWTIPECSCYKVKPMTGTIPSGRFIYCMVEYTPNIDYRNCVKLIVNCGGGTPVHIHVNACYSKNNVEVLEHKIEMPHIPLNIPTERKNILRNQGDETVLFQLRNPCPCYGVTIKPEKGSIRGRTDVALTITFHFETFVKFDFKVEIDFEFGSTHFLILGRVDYPLILCKPKDIIRFKRIPAESFLIVPFSIENKAESIVHLTFPKTSYPEITVSASNKINVNLCSNIELTLESKESVNLYIHFHPLDVCMNTIYLPIVINHILGPAEMYDDRSLLAQQYLKESSFSTCYESNIETINYKTKMSVLTLSTVSTKYILRFSKFLLTFKYLPTFPNRSVTTIQFKIKNCMKEQIEFCFDISGMLPNFDLSSKISECVTYRDNDVMALLIDEEEEITLIAYYIPITPGDYVCNIPIYIKNYCDEAVFNYIKLNASHPPPTFKTPRWCLLEPVPLCTTVLYDLKVLLCNHFPSCVMELKSDLEQLSFIIKSCVQDPNKPCRSSACVQLRFQSPTAISGCKKMFITCSCGAETFLIVCVCAADDIISTYTHYCPNVPYEKVMKSREFPYFPEESDTSEFAIYMRRCVVVVERWLFEQALNQTYYYYLPNDMTGYYRTITQKHKNNLKNPSLILIHILANVGCPDIAPACSTTSTDDLSRVNDVHCTLKHILIYLHKQGAYIPHIRSRYLLTYNDYILYMNKIRPMKDKSLQCVKSEALFYRRSKQCWLDLILSIFKLFVLCRISIKKFRSSSRRMSSVSKESSSLLALNLSPEQSLLSWLDMIFQDERNNLLKLDRNRPENFVFRSNPIVNFTSDLKDGIILIAVTIHFCPYLIPHFQDIYVDVDAPEKAYHNAIILVEAWKLINCSFKITPEEIIDPMPLQMLFLLMYMYDAFYALYPKEELTFTGSLSTKEIHEILIRNPNTTDLNYEIRFLNNTNECFKALTSSNLIRIPGGKSYKLKIEFTAKKIENRKAALLLCGDTAGQLYCKSIAYTLIGTSNLLGEHSQYIFEVDLYKAATVEFKIESPYKEAATYDCLCAKLVPKDVQIEKLIMVKDYLATIQPRTVYSDEHTFTTDEKGIGIKTIQICALSTNNFNATIVFRNENVGDFFISIEVQPINFDLIKRHSIVVHLPDDWDERVCNCCGINKFVSPSRCAKRVIMYIPCKNDQFWNIIIEAIMQCIPENEKQVWNKFLENEMGPHILHWLMSGSQEIKTVQHMLDSNITYKVNNKNSTILLPETVTIENVRSDNYIEIELHIKGDISIKTADFSLQSLDGTEFRWYEVEFQKINRPPGVVESTCYVLTKPIFHSII